MMNTRRAILLYLLVALAPGLAGAGGEPALRSMPDYDAADPGAAPVTAASILEGEVFWPYHVGLTRAWQPEGDARPLAAGRIGVLIRVEPSGAARIDFGRDGRQRVPLDATDLVARANRIRRGEAEKVAPNFVLAVAPRLITASTPSMRPYPVDGTSEHRGFLCVFADPEGDGFGALAAALAPLSERHGVLTILVPEGRVPDARVREKLRALGWMVPFVSDPFAESVRRSLLAEAAPLPAVQLQTPEGRVLFEGRGLGAMPGLAAALDRSFSPGVARAEAAAQGAR